jgi:hypothetical protein
MRPEGESTNSETERRGGASETPDIEQAGSWEILEMLPDEEAEKKLTQDLFGDVLAKLEYLFNKDKKKFEKMMKDKRHGH